MNCIHCGKSFKDPLELYSGELKCPHCGTDVIPSFAVTKENRDLFVLSEQFFHTYLAEASKRSAAPAAQGNARKLKRAEKDTDRLLKQAIEYCRRAAYAGYPEALVRLGYYYDNNYIDYGRSDSDRDEIAYKYYTSVLFDEAQNGTDGSGRNTPVEKRLLDAWAKAPDTVPKANAGAVVSDLRHRAAIALLTMLSLASEELARQEKYSLRTHYERLVAARAIDAGTFSIRRVELPKADRVEKIFNLLYSFGRQSERSPFFGYYVLNGKEAYRLTERLNGLSSKERSACKLLVQGAPVTYEDGAAILNISQVYTLARRTGKIAQDERIPETASADEKFCIFFFNVNCDGVYARKNMIEEFINKFDGLRSGGFSLLLNEDVRTYREKTGVVQIVEHIFYADDLYYVKKCKDDTHILCKLIDA